MFCLKHLSLHVQYEQEGRPLPKFGEWDVNDPASAEGFTVIFNKARDDKKTGAGSVRVQSQRRNNSRKDEDKTAKAQKKWFCFKP